MHVVATAGHVDHGKSTLVRALTGIEPDRWAEERRRGLTIDLGYAWTTLPSGEQVAFVDVPGHERFLGNMLAGLGPAPAVVFVVAADEGWRAQSEEHLGAVDSLGLEHGLLVVTRSDLADPAPALADARERLARTSLGVTPAVAVSARTGEGLVALRDQLDGLVARLPEPDREARVRLWVDRAFTIKGAGTVVTGTLAQGTLRVGDELELDGRRLRIRGLQSLEQPHDAVASVARVAVNLRDVTPEEVPRGTPLTTPGTWWRSAVLDARLTADPADVPGTVTLHVGTAALEAHLRPLRDNAVRLTLPRELPWVAGDRVVLREPGGHRLLGGGLVLDPDPPALTRRGDGRRRGEALTAYPGAPDLALELERRGALRTDHARRLGLDPTRVTGGVEAHGDWLVSTAALTTWGNALRDAVGVHAAADPLNPSLPLEAARAAAGVPDVALVPVVATAAGLEVRAGRVWVPGVAGSLGEAEAGLARLEARLAAEPFVAPERPELDAAGLGARQLAAAERLGRVLRLPDDVVLLPTAPALAMRRLAALPQPFTASDARQALGTTRRVVIPLLEHLDARGWTRRVDGQRREVVRG